MQYHDKPLHRRQQITLFVPHEQGQPLDAIRQHYNPAQAKLINSHVTLCRDDELLEWEHIRVHASESELPRIRLQFGAPKRDENLVFLPVLGSTEEFQELRKLVLDNPDCREHEPHITLIHPRNGTCTDEDFDAICKIVEEHVIDFTELSFISCLAGEPWKVIESVPLRS